MLGYQFYQMHSEYFVHDNFTFFIGILHMYNIVKFEFVCYLPDWQGDL